MARRESVALGGYYPTPLPIVEAISQHIRVDTCYTAIDPCAGDGSAILKLTQNLGSKSYIFAIEMESDRFKSLKNQFDETLSWKHQSLKGDAFRANWEISPNRGLSLLFLNPPYDFDYAHKRSEEKFLARFKDILAPGGLLVLVVPFYALAASAKTLAQYFESIECYKFPKEDFDIYKQVVLFGCKREQTFFVNTDIESQIMMWSESPPSAEIGSVQTLFSLPKTEQYAIDKFELKSTDFRSIIDSYIPWHATDRSGKPQAMSGVVTKEILNNGIARTYPIAMPPRSAHIAAGIASGIFNGARIEAASKSLPPILVKGAFNKEYRTVDEKKDKDGVVKSLVQIQQPKLVTTVLNLATGGYTTVKPETNRTFTSNVEDMTMADLLAEYGQGLMDTMLRQCPVLHNPKNPEHEIELSKLARPLFEAQADTAKATIKLLGGLHCSKRKRRFKSAFVLGEIGSGKTSVALAAAETIKAKRILVMCPPHLLDSWRDQILAVTPWIRSFVIGNIQDFQDFVHNPKEQLIAIMSRETAKLGHALESVQGKCPKCGSEVPPGDHGKQRYKCKARPLIKVGIIGDILEKLTFIIMKVFPKHSHMRQILRNPTIHKILKSKEPVDWGSLDKSSIVQIAKNLIDSETTETTEAAVALCRAVPQPDLIAYVVQALNKRSESSYHNMELLSNLLLLADSPILERVFVYLSSESKIKWYNPWTGWVEKRNYVWREGSPVYSSVKVTDGKIVWDNRIVGSPTNVLDAIEILAPVGFTFGKQCGEPLFQAIPQPRRYPLATYISHKYPNLFDFLILDEGHEYAADNSAQSHAAHRLTALGIPTLLLTGTIMNGYAESMFINTWALSKTFREEFSRDDRMSFINRYGYRKRLVEDTDKDTGKVVSFGMVSDRVERSEKVIGRAPGVLPLFLFRYLLPISVTLHKADLSTNIPNCTENTVSISPSSHQLKEYERLKKALLEQIKHDRSNPELAGKLWGALAQFPSYLDMATEDLGEYRISYPESVGESVVASACMLPSETILPKEQWMLDRVALSLEEGRQVLVFAWHVRLLPRLANLIQEHLKIKCPILNPAKVSTSKRQAWIDREVVRNNSKVLVVNPVAIQTGLNNLVYFSDEIWMENPACNPITYRQAVGRVDRIGQTEETNIYFPIYESTAQKELHSLLLHKVAVSMATDGLDAEGVLLAAGIGEDSGFTSFAVGRQLYEILTKSEK